MRTHVPFVCPVCEGARRLHRSFYDPVYPGNPMLTPMDLVDCLSCLGTGLVWAVGTDEAETEDAEGFEEDS